MSQFTYKDAGVDLEQYQQAMGKIPALLQRTYSSRVMDLPGGFAGLFRLNDESRRYQDPVLVSGSDGVGTKIKVAMLAASFDTIGIDLVAMCVNDCLCLGAEPLFFLDYLALGKDNPTLIEQLVTGVSTGCQQAGAALLGGETAIMPDLYADDDFDLAGFCVGVVERDQLLDGRQRIKPGDVVLGLPSNGFHSNGYSLIRKVVFEAAGLTVDDRIEELGQTVGEVLLTPTRIYADVIGRLGSDEKLRAGLHGLAHITGGGLAENLERILPDDCAATLKRSSWTVPPCFTWLDGLGNIGDEEMFRVFNMGVGMTLVVDAGVVDAVIESLAAENLTPYLLGDVIAGQGKVVMVD